MIYAFFPLLAAMFYGIAFAFTERAMHSINITTYMILGAIAQTVMALVLMKFRSENISVGLVDNKLTLSIVAIAVVAPSLGWFFSVFAIKYVNASYAAFAEISYPLFTMLALFLFFGMRSLDWSVAVGGLLILVGSSIMVLGQMSKT